MGLGTTAGYLLHKRTTLLTGQKRSQLPSLETCSALMSSVLQSPSELVPKSLKAQNAAAAKLLVSRGFMACPVLKMPLPKTFSHRLHPQEVIDPYRSPLYLWACRPDKWRKEAGVLTLGPWYRGLRVVWDATVVDTFTQGHYKDCARQASFAAAKAEIAKCQKYHDLQSNYHFQPVEIETTGVYGKSTSPFFEWSCKETCWCVWPPQGAPPASVPGCGQRKCC